MTGQDFLNLKIGDYIHDLDNGDEWIVESNDGLYVNCRCTIAGLRGHWIDKEYPWMASVAHYFTKGKIKPTWPWIYEGLPNIGEVVFVRLVGGGYAIAFQEDGAFQDKTHFGYIEVESWMHIPE